MMDKKTIPDAKKPSTEPSITEAAKEFVADKSKTRDYSKAVDKAVSAVMEAVEENIHKSVRRTPASKYKVGDLVTPRYGYPVLYEIVSLEPDGTLRVRGLNWAPGYGALVSLDEVRPVTLSPASEPKTKEEAQKE